MFLIAGPTAVGKTEIAVSVARRCGGEIVGGDAFQIYEGMPLVTAKPPPEVLAAVPHHLIGCVPRSEAFDVARYLERARAAIAGIRRRGALPIVVGGTGLYLRALTHGLADLPPADAEIRSQLESESLEGLRDRLLRVDPLAAESVDLANRRRVVRALEVQILTGRPFTSFREQWKGPAADFFEGVRLTRDRAELDRRIEQRTREMFAAGLLEEVRGLADLGPTAERAIGIPEVRACLRGEISEVEAMRRIALATRQYAKRQDTWFRRETALEPFDLSGEDTDAILRRIVERADAAKAHPGSGRSTPT